MTIFPVTFSMIFSCDFIYIQFGLMMCPCHGFFIILLIT